MQDLYITYGSEKIHSENSRDHAYNMPLPLWPQNPHAHYVIV